MRAPSGPLSSLATNTLAAATGDLLFVAGTSGYSVNNDFTEGIELTMSSSDAVVGFKKATGTDEIPSITHSNLNRQVVVGFVVQNDALMANDSVVTLATADDIVTALAFNHIVAA